MACREVAMFEIKEIIRLFGEGVPKKAIARIVGVDPKTVRSSVAAAEALGLAGLLDDDGLARLLRELRVDVAERAHGEAWRQRDEQRDAIKEWLKDGVKLTKVRKLLERRNVYVPYPTLHRFAAEQLDFGRRRHSVRVVDPPAGAELQVDTGFVWRLDGVSKLPTVSRGQRSFDEADIPAHRRAYALRDERFLVEQAKEHSDVIGAFAETLCTGQAAWTRMRRVSALLSLVKRFGVARVDAAAQEDSASRWAGRFAGPGPKSGPVLPIRPWLQL
jgi:hypothetical protein